MNVTLSSHSVLLNLSRDICDLRRLGIGETFDTVHKYRIENEILRGLAKTFGHLEICINLLAKASNILNVYFEPTKFKTKIGGGIAKNAQKCIDLMWNDRDLTLPDKYKLHVLPKPVGSVHC